MDVREKPTMLVYRGVEEFTTQIHLQLQLLRQMSTRGTAPLVEPHLKITNYIMTTSPSFFKTMKPPSTGFLLLQILRLARVCKNLRALLVLWTGY